MKIRLFGLALAAAAVIGGAGTTSLAAQTSTSTTVDANVAVVRRFTAQTAGTLGTVTPGVEKTVNIGISTGSARVEFEFNAPTTVNLTSGSTTLGSGAGAATVTFTCGWSETGNLDTLESLASCTAPVNFTASSMTSKAFHVGFNLPAAQSAKMLSGIAAGNISFVLGAGT